ncbi:hypothetical protein PQX77_009527 [Marasmius sp. AFHP31]|nr:hypothetical protein PQX77_009527 [Marasmius sp. AFHP31]
MTEATVVNDNEGASLDRGKLFTFNALQILGFVLCTLVFVTAVLSKTVRRTSLWFCFMGAWIPWCAVHSLLFLTGYQAEDKPPFGLCLLQASLVYAFPPCVMLLNVGVLTQMYLLVRAGISRHDPPKRTTRIFCVIVIAIALTIVLGVLAVSIQLSVAIEY